MAGEGRHRLAPGSVHVWHVDLDAVVHRRPEVESWLSPDERDRAERFRFERDRRRFVAGRGALRAVLAAYINEDPRALRFVYGVHGRPELDGGTAVRFNLAHSRDRGVIALTERAPIGIDIETAREMPDVDDLAPVVFSTAELEEVAAARNREVAFLRGWTRKEAILKALGTGLSAVEHACSVSLGEHAAVLAIDGPHGPAAEWTLRDLSDQTAIIALAVKSREPTIDTHRFETDIG
jgi:4'-phosphopantetheinyl transferase